MSYRDAGIYLSGRRRMKPSRSATSQRIVLHALSLLLLLLVLTSDYLINVPLVMAASVKTQPLQAQGTNTIDAFHKVGNSDTKHYYGPLKRSTYIPQGN